MIDYIKGRLVHMDGETVVVDVGGIGYKIRTSAASCADFSIPGECVTVYTELIVREDALFLVGFSSRDELEVFQRLISVSGVGTKVALGILSSIPAAMLCMAIASEDVKTLTSAQGVGKKTAERIVLELKDKIGVPGFAGSLSGTEDAWMQNGDGAQSRGITQRDAMEALTALGYTRSEAQAALRGMPMETMTLEAVIKAALKQLML